MYADDKYVDQAYDSYRYGDYDGHGVDLHDDQDYSAQGAKIPEEVKKFLLYFRDCINEGMIFELQNIYESMFPKLMEDHFGSDKWPVVEVVAPIVGRDPVFLTLYKELYYRNIYATAHGPAGPNLEERFKSFYNYCDLFTYILSAEQPVPLELPDQWLWELVDEFIFQFQSFSRYQSSTKISPEELTYIQADKSVWNVINVLNVLHSMIDKSNIKRQLEVYASGGDPNSVAGDFGRHSLYKMLGYFSLVGLLRLHSLLGDYYQAIKVLKNIELHKKSQYAHVPACQISTSYYVGFAYMMMRRYSDAITTFCSSLLYFQRTKQLFDSDTYQNDQINKQVTKMYKLLAMCLVLHPQCIDESLQQALKDKNLQEMMKNMERGDIKEFETCFLFSCPKFLSPTPTPDVGADLAEEARMHQKQVFIDEVRQQKWLPTIRSYLKLYTTLPLSKLATFMKMPIFITKNQKEILPQKEEEKDKDKDKEEEENNKGKELIIHLLCFKHKMKNIVWTKGTSGLEGKFKSGSELDFYIDRDMIHIADTKVAHRYGVFFIGKVLKFEELNRKLHMLKV